MYINIALHYIRPKQTVHVREALQPLIRDVIATEDLDLEVDPKQVAVSRFPRFLELTRTFSDIPHSYRPRGNARWESNFKVKRHQLQPSSQ